MRPCLMLRVQTCWRSSAIVEDEEQVLRTETVRLKQKCTVGILKLVNSDSIANVVDLSREEVCPSGEVAPTMWGFGSLGKEVIIDSAASARACPSVKRHDVSGYD